MGWPPEAGRGLGEGAGPRGGPARQPSLACSRDRSARPRLLQTSRPAKMAAEREPPPLGDVKPTDFEELEDGEDLFTSTVSTLEVRRPPARRPALCVSPLPCRDLSLSHPPTPPPGLARPGRVTPVTPAAPQVPVKGPEGGLGGQASGRQPAGLGADPPSPRGRDPRTEAHLTVLAGGLSGLPCHSRLFLQAGARLVSGPRGTSAALGFLQLRAEVLVSLPHRRVCPATGEPGSREVNS